MGFKWLDNESWTDITRDERFFCSHLYNAILNHEEGVAGFVDLINAKCDLGLPVTDSWELGYEVCFYRDIKYRFPLKCERYERDVKKLSPKRTFDLCLFSDEHIVIIEAKAFQGFGSAQVENFADDKKTIEQLGLDGIENVYLIALASSSYNFTNSKTCEYFDGDLTWRDLSKKYDNESALPLLNYADGLRQRRKGESARPLKNEKGSI